MSEADLENFERRAAEAEAQLAALEKRVASVERAAPAAPAKAAEADLAPILAELRRVLALVNAEEKAAKAVIAGTPPACVTRGLTLVPLHAERDALKAENAKLQYRVNILVRSLQEEESKNQAKQ